MAYTGTIYIKEIGGNPAGVGQPITILGSSSTGYAAYLRTADGNVQFSEPFETEKACLEHIKGDGGGTTVIIDDLAA